MNHEVNVQSDRRCALLAAVADEGRLREAWRRVRLSGGGPGADGVSLEVFRARLDRSLADLRAKIGSRAYKPGPLLRTRIPKATGGFRIMGIPSVLDRIAQTAAALVLNEHLADTWSDASFAYRPYLGPKRAAARLVQLLRPGSWAIIADIEKFFDNVEHKILLDQLSNCGVDNEGLGLITRWLTGNSRTGKRAH